MAKDEDQNDFGTGLAALCSHIKQCNTALGVPFRSNCKRIRGN